MKGIILAGGSGTRLYPITKAVSKQLLPIYDKPMIYYPLSVLMLAGIKDILIITTSEDQTAFKRLLGDGSNFGVNLDYIIQPSPDGLAQAFILGEEFIGDDEVALILGDNIFYGNGFIKMLEQAKENVKAGYATIFGCEVKDPQRFGIMELDSDNNVISVEEKPEKPKSNLCITGLYFYDNSVINKAKSLKPSKRGELEITDLNRLYLEEAKLKACQLGGGFDWLDTGTFASLKEASDLICSRENTSGKIIACLEQIAYDKGWIDNEKLLELANLYAKNAYGEYLKQVSEKVKRI